MNGLVCFRKRTSIVLGFLGIKIIHRSCKSNKATILGIVGNSIFISNEDEHGFAMA